MLMGIIHKNIIIMKLYWQHLFIYLENSGGKKSKPNKVFNYGTNIPLPSSADDAADTKFTLIMF